MVTMAVQALSDQGHLHITLSKAKARTHSQLWNRGGCSEPMVSHLRSSTQDRAGLRAGGRGAGSLFDSSVAMTVSLQSALSGCQFYVLTHPPSQKEGCRRVGRREAT